MQFLWKADTRRTFEEKIFIYQVGVAAHSQGLRYLHLEVSDESLHSDIFFDLQEEAVAAQHHALQDVQGHLLYWCIGWHGVDEAGNLKGEEEEMEGEKGGRRWE